MGGFGRTMLTGMRLSDDKKQGDYALAYGLGTLLIYKMKINHHCNRTGNINFCIVYIIVWFPSNYLN